MYHKAVLEYLDIFDYSRHWRLGRLVEATRQGLLAIIMKIIMYTYNTRILATHVHKASSLRLVAFLAVNVHVLSSQILFLLMAAGHEKWLKRVASARGSRPRLPRRFKQVNQHVRSRCPRANQK